MPADRVSPAAHATSVGELLDHLRTRRARVGVIGMGYVGLPLALTAAKAGFTALGFNINASYVERLKQGESYITHIPAELVTAAIAEERLEATDDFSHHAPLAGRRSFPLTSKGLSGYDAVLIATDHDWVDNRLIAEQARLAINTRNVFAKAGIASERLVKA